MGPIGPIVTLHWSWKRYKAFSFRGLCPLQEFYPWRPCIPPGLRPQTLIIGERSALTVVYSSATSEILFFPPTVASWLNVGSRTTPYNSPGTRVF